MHHEKSVEDLVTEDHVLTDEDLAMEEAANEHAVDELAPYDADSPPTGPPESVHLTKLQEQTRSRANPGLLNTLMEASRGISDIPSTMPRSRPMPMPRPARVPRSTVHERPISGFD